jgi:hypothetical protein
LNGNAATDERSRPRQDGRHTVVARGITGDFTAEHAAAGTACGDGVFNGATRRVGVTAFTLGGAGVEKNTDRRSRTAWWQDDYLFSAFEFRQLIVKPCAEVADLAAPIAGGLLGQSQPIDNLLRQMVGVIR